MSDTIIAQPFTPAQLAAAVSPETAVVIPDYPYGFRLRCMMRVWVEFKRGKGFRYVTQTTNPKKPGTVWNKPKASTYARWACAIGQDCEGHLRPVYLTEYSSTEEARTFIASFGPNLCEDARKSAAYWYAMKLAHDEAVAAQGLSNVFDGTPEQRSEIRKAGMSKMAELYRAGFDY